MAWSELYHSQPARCSLVDQGPSEPCYATDVAIAVAAVNSVTVSGQVRAGCVGPVSSHGSKVMGHALLT